MHQPADTVAITSLATANATSGQTWRKRLQKLGLSLWVLLWPLVGMAIYYPIKDTSLRLFIVVGLLAMWSGMLLFFWKQGGVRLFCVALALVVAAVGVLPGRQSDAVKLRREYLRSLSYYEGTVYMWGGESKRGIDCSGLIRRGLIDADLRHGLTTGNPALIREALGLWWYDCSARALKEEYRQKTRLILEAPSLNRLDYARVQAGDIAVTSNGVHTMAYIGDKTWVEADPGDWKVIKVHTPSKNAWFSMPVHIMRWRQFD